MEKKSKYQVLVIELRKVWKTCVNVVPVVIGVLGAVDKVEDELIKMKMEKKEIWRVQFQALLGTAMILRRHWTSQAS